MTGQIAHCWNCRRATPTRQVGTTNGTLRTTTLWGCDRCHRTRLQMGDVTDALALCRSVLDSRRARLRDDEYDDALSALYEAILHIWEKYDPDYGVPFLAYATGRLRFAFSDWGRETFGRSEATAKPHASAVRFDDYLRADGSADPDGPLGSTFPERPGAAQDDRAAALYGLFTARDRGTLREVASLGVDPRQAASG